MNFSFTPLDAPLRITEHNWPEGTAPLVHTRHMTFNHKDYIKECIEGVLMQKATFPVQILIHDDCSTDGTDEIVKYYELKYPKLIKAYYQPENSYSKPDKFERRKEFDLWRIGKYEAICEGDDYWIDPLKLQKQIDFLESNPVYGLTYTDVDIYYENNNRLKKSAFENNIEGLECHSNIETFIRKGQYLAPCTWVFKKSIYDKFKENMKVHSDGSFSFMIEFMLCSEVKFLPFTTAVYRYLNESASHTQNPKKKINRALGIYKTKKYYLSKLNILEKNHHDIILRLIKSAMIPTILLNEKKQTLELEKIIGHKYYLRVLFLFLNTSLTRVILKNLNLLKRK